MKYHALFVIFEKAANFVIIIGGALRVKRVASLPSTDSQPGHLPSLSSH